MNSSITPISYFVEDFRKHIAFGVDAIRQAAESYVAACHKFSNAQEVFERNFPTITERTWGLLTKIGNGEANANILICSQSFGDKIARLPIAQQDRLLSSSGVIKVYSPHKDKVEDVKFCDITPSQERIIFDDSTGKIRSAKDQKIYVNALAEAEKVKPKTLPYRLVGNSLIVNGRCEILVSELLRIINEQHKNITKKN